MRFVRISKPNKSARVEYKVKYRKTSFVLYEKCCGYAAQKKNCAYPAGIYSAVSGVFYTAMNICYMAGYLAISYLKNKASISFYHRKTTTS